MAISRDKRNRERLNKTFIHHQARSTTSIMVAFKGHCLKGRRAERKSNCDRLRSQVKSAFKVTIICRKVIGSSYETRLKEDGIGRFSIIMLILILFLFIYFCFQNLISKNHFVLVKFVDT